MIVMMLMTLKRHLLNGENPVASSHTFNHPTCCRQTYLIMWQSLLVAVDEDALIIGYWLLVIDNGYWWIYDNDISREQGGARGWCQGSIQPE